MQPVSRPVLKMRSSTLPATTRGPVNVVGLEPARVLEALINAPFIDGHARWRPIHFAEAQRITGPSNRWNISRWGEQMLRITYNNGMLYGLGYDAVFDEMHSGQVMARLRAGESFEVPPSPGHLRATAPSFTPALVCCASSPQIDAATPPTESALTTSRSPPPRFLLKSFVLPSKEYLLEVLPTLMDDRWYREILVPELLQGAGKSMTADVFVNFFFLRISRACDDTPNTALAERLMEFADNVVLRSLLPSEDALWAVGARMMATRQLQACSPTLKAPQQRLAKMQQQQATQLLALLEKQQANVPDPKMLSPD